MRKFIFEFSESINAANKGSCSSSFILGVPVNNGDGMPFSLALADADGHGTALTLMKAVADDDGVSVTLAVGEDEGIAQRLCLGSR